MSLLPIRLQRELILITTFNKNMRIDHINKIMSRRHNIFTEKFTTLFSIAGKTENVPECDLDEFQKSSFYI